MNSVVPDWISKLPFQQQSVLLLATRGPDGVRKHHDCKLVLQAYRAFVLKAALFGRELREGEEGDTFMSLKIFFEDSVWPTCVRAYFNVIDEIPHHAHMHLLHGAQILGYKHPSAIVRDRWRAFYELCCDDNHMPPESEEVMDRRLSDWNHSQWALNPEPPKAAIYVASKAFHGDRWRELRGHGIPIISTWIDQAGKGMTDDWTALWESCIREASNCTALVVYKDEGEVLKGALLEIGAALSAGKMVYGVGVDEFTFINHPNMVTLSNLEAAFALAVGDDGEALRAVRRYYG